MAIQSDSPQPELDPQTQAFFENLLNQWLQQQEQQFLHIRKPARGQVPIWKAFYSSLTVSKP
jgi:secreted Zn-dependent insulinase-like peptidase